MSEEAAPPEPVAPVSVGAAVVPDPVAPPPTVADAIAPPPPPEAEARWFDSFDDPTKEFLGKKGWDQEGKGPQDVIQGYQNLEKLKGDPSRMLPDPEDPVAVAEFNERLGVPVEATGYEMPPTDFRGESLQAEPLQAISHELGHTAAQHAKFVAATNQLLVQADHNEQIAKNEADTAQKTQLESDWAGTKDENYAAAGRAAKQFGIDEATMDEIQQGLGFRKTMEMFAKIGRSFGESAAPAPPSGGVDESFGLTPASARAQIDELSSDQTFRDRLFAKDATATAKWANLKKVAFSG